MLISLDGLQDPAAPVSKVIQSLPSNKHIRTLELIRFLPRQVAGSVPVTISYGTKFRMDGAEVGFVWW